MGLYAKEKVVEVRPKTRKVYLPAGSTWVDFWTGRTMPGGTTITAEAPIDRVPLLVKAGAILPLGPTILYAAEKPADPIELRIYPGADGQFVLYEDEGDNYNYEKGVYATIGFHWDNSQRTLTMENRQGKFPGMLRQRSFHLVLVGQGHGAGMDLTEKPDLVVSYDGRQKVMKF